MHIYYTCTCEATYSQQVQFTLVFMSCRVLLMHVASVQVIFNVSMRTEFCHAGINGTVFQLTAPYVGHMDISLECVSLDHCKF